MIARLVAALALGAVMGGAGLLAPAEAQSITIDGSLSPARTLAGPNYAVGAELGRQVGGNLFHSFGKFGLASGESATFSGPATVTNVIGRVTGGSPSDIEGAIHSTIAGASLYLVNPNGIVFGPGATVDVSGAFHASTADYLKMSDGARFQATNPSGSTFSAAAPAAFGFLNAQPATITLSGSTIALASGQTLGLVGGPVAIAGASLSAPAGTIRIASAAGPGEIPIDPNAAGVAAPANFGAVAISGGAKLSVDDLTGLASGGSIFVRSGTLTIDGSELAADNIGPGSGGQMLLQGDSSIAVTGHSNLHAATAAASVGPPIAIRTAPDGSVTGDAASIGTFGFGAGPAGAVTVDTGSLTLRNGAAIGVISEAAGNGGALTINAGSVALDSAAAVGTVALSDGKAGDVGVTAGTLSVQNGATLVSSTSGNGSAGAVSVNAGQVSLDGRGLILDKTLGPGNAGPMGVNADAITIGEASEIGSTATAAGSAGDVTVAVTGPLTVNGTSTTAFAGIISNSVTLSGSAPAVGDSGNVRVTAGSLTLLGNGAITASSFSDGNAGNVDVRVAGAATLTGGSVPPFASIAADANSGNAGSVRFSAGSVAMANGAELSAQTSGPNTAGDVSMVSGGDVTLTDGANIGASNFGTGSAGNISIDAAGAVTIAGASATGIFPIGSQVGRSGNITIAAGSLSLGSNAGIVSVTAGSGAAGDIDIRIAGALTLDGSAALATISSNAFPGSSGRGGNVTVAAGSLSMNAGDISSDTAGTGAGGDVKVTTSGDVAMRNGALISSGTLGAGNGGTVNVTTQGALQVADLGTQITAKATANTTGRAGSVSVSAGQIALTNGGQISSTTEGSAPGGSVLVSGGDILISGRNSLITAQSATGADAGSIAIAADQVRLSDVGGISTGGFGGNGGNITLAVGDLLYLEHGFITTSSGGIQGNGGNITIDPRFVVLNGGLIDADAFGGNGGNIAIRAGEFLASSDSVVTASSQLGIAGTISIMAPQVALNGGLVALSSALHAPAAVLPDACETYGGRLHSSLVAGGRGGLVQDPDAALPALYLAGRELTGGAAQITPPIGQIAMQLHSPCD